MIMLIYPFPENYEKISEQFSVSCENKPVGVYSCDVSAEPFNQVWPGYQRPFEQTEPTSYVSLGSDNPFTLTITPQKSFEKVTVRPLSKNIVPEIMGGSVTVTFPGPGQYSVEFDDRHNVLTVFANPEKTFSVNPDGENVMYFGPGVHYFDEKTELDDNQTVYIDKGAVLYGSLYAENKKNVRILGYGILDNSSFRRSTGAPVRFSHCENVLVEGITVVNSSEWSMHFSGCENVCVDNIKLIGMWRYNSDGCDFTNCTDACIKNSYLRNYDDCIVVKGLTMNREMPVKNILAENCVLWCDWGRAIEIGAETSAPFFSGVHFKNCDIIHGDAVMMDIQHGDRAEISDIVFEDIRAEYTAKASKPLLQTARDEQYVNHDENYMPNLFTVITVRTIYSHDETTGNISGVTFKNISVMTEDGRTPPSFIGATAPDTSISGITFENISVNGKKCITPQDLNLTVATSDKPGADLPAGCIVGASQSRENIGTVKDVQII